MKKNLITILTAAIMVVSSTAVFADEAPKTENDIVPISAPISDEGLIEAPVILPASYISNTVTVTEVTEEKISTTLNAEDAENPENTINYTVSDNTIVLGLANGDVKNIKDIKKGDKITVYSNSYSPAPLILPPQYTADVIFVEDNLEIDSLRTVDVDTYVKNGEMLVNVSNTLALNIGEDTEIVDKEGKKVDEKDLDKKDLAVIYSVSTRSIPAQTTPIKVVVLGENEMALAHLEAAKNEATPAPEVTPEVTAEPDDIEVDFKNVKSIKVGDKSIENVYLNGDSTLMVPLREIAETLGFTVEWSGETKSVMLNGGIYSLQIGVNAYNKGKMMPETLSCAPEIRSDDLTYVPFDYFMLILEAKADVTLNENGIAESVTLEYSPVENSDAE